MEQRKAVIKEKDTILGRRDSKEVLIWGGGVIAKEEVYGTVVKSHLPLLTTSESQSDDLANHQPGLRMTRAQGGRGPATTHFLPCPSSGSQPQKSSGDLVENS